MAAWVLVCLAASPALALPTFNFFSAPAPPPAPAPFKFPQAPARPVSQDCVYGEWTAWSQCTADCDAAAFISRTRIVVKKESGYGTPCDPSLLEEWRECRGQPCARDCVMGQWASWTPCSAQCGDGQRQRLRQILSGAVNGGLACGPQEEVERCNDGPCPIDCEMSPWSQWSGCSEDCGSGSRARVRSVLVKDAFGGQMCGPAEEWEACNNGPCPRDCIVGQWSPWTPCPSCGQADRSRRRSIIEQGAFGGIVCDFSDLAESESCNASPCPVDCVMEAWSAWSRCSSECGPGRRARTRNVLVAAAFGGQSCGPAEEWEACESQPCAVDCEMTPWGAWTGCSADCDGGSRARYRSVSVQPQNGGLVCGPVEDWESCNVQPCPRDCALGEWAPWSQCPQCGQASRNRRRPIAQQAAFGGRQCDFAALFETESCNLSPCPVDCKMASWSAWSQCSSECGEGRRQRLRSIDTPAAFGGLPCGPAEEWEACNDRPCPRDCVLGDWAPWSPCPSCGQASRSRRRSIVEHAAFGGQQCDFAGLSESESCNVPSCAVDCAVSEWSKWSQCSADCGPGSQQRLRSIITPASNGGRQCPSLEDWRECNNGPCKKPSICDTVPGSQFFAEGCTAEFTLCSNGEEHLKLCPGPSRFDVVSSTCRLPEDVPACLSAQPPAPAPKPSSSVFSQIGQFFSYDSTAEEIIPAPTNPEPNSA